MAKIFSTDLVTVRNNLPISLWGKKYIINDLGWTNLRAPHSREKNNPPKNKV